MECLRCYLRSRLETDAQGNGNRFHDLFALDKEIIHETENWDLLLKDYRISSIDMLASKNGENLPTTIYKYLEERGINDFSLQFSLLLDTLFKRDLFTTDERYRGKLFLVKEIEESPFEKEGSIRDVILDYCLKNRLLTFRRVMEYAYEFSTGKSIDSTFKRN